MGLEEHVQEELMHLIGDVANIFATGESEGEMAAGSDGGRMSGTGSEGGIPSPISSPRLSPNKRQSRDSEGSFDWSLPGTGEDSRAECQQQDDA